ncbi:hypothetical protein [Saccharothrix stipae]
MEEEVPQEGTQDGAQDDTAAPVVPEVESDQHEHHHHEHDHEHEDGEVSPMCSGGGCVTKTPA